MLGDHRFRNCSRFRAAIWQPISQKRAQAACAAVASWACCGGTYQGVAFALAAPSEVEVGTVAASGIRVAGAGRLAAGTGGGGKTALDHGLGGEGELLEKFIPTHIKRVG